MIQYEKEIIRLKALRDPSITQLIRSSRLAAWVHGMNTENAVLSGADSGSCLQLDVIALGVFQSHRGIMHGGWTAFGFDHVGGILLNIVASHNGYQKALGSHLEVFYDRPLRVGSRARFISQIDSIDKAWLTVRNNLVMLDGNSPGQAVLCAHGTLVGKMI